jgi:hypothetical protein
MAVLGVHLTLLIGPTVPEPAPPPLMEALRRVEVTETGQGRSGFQLTFEVGRGGPADRLDYSLLSLPLLRPFSRLVLVVAFGAMPRVLFDGFITHRQLAPGDQPGTDRLTVTGEDISVMMDLQEKAITYPAQSAAMIVEQILLTYARYGVIAEIIPPETDEVPLPIDRVPVQHDTDLVYLRGLAARFGYVFYVSPGLVPTENMAYWGPPKRIGLPQAALTVNAGPSSNVESLEFREDDLAPTLMAGLVQDRNTNEALPIETLVSTRPPLVSEPALVLNDPNVRTRLLQDVAGVSFEQALGRAQARLDASVDAVVTATGELDALRYGDVLRARGLVGLRGVGDSFDGTYYVNRVTHLIGGGTYRQRFSLTREGIGALEPVVRP